MQNKNAYAKYFIGLYGVLSVGIMCFQILYIICADVADGKHLLLQTMWNLFYACRYDISNMQVQGIGLLAVLPMAYMAILLCKVFLPKEKGFGFICLLGIAGQASKRVFVLPFSIQDACVLAVVFAFVVSLKKEEVDGCQFVNRKRDLTFDFAKGVAILLMIYDHVKMSGSFITSFHMPLFFLLSGYFMTETLCAKTLGKKVKELLVPYFKYGIIASVAGGLLLMFSENYTVGQTIRYLGYRIKGMMIGYDIWLTWFLICLFLASVMFLVMHHFLKTKVWFEWIAYIALGFIGLFLSQFRDDNICYFDVACVAVQLVALGFYARRVSWDKLSQAKRWILLCVCMVIWAIGIHNGGVVMAMRSYPYYPYCIISAIAGTYVVVRFSSKLVQIPFLGDVFVFAGQNTLFIVCVTNIIRQYVDWNGLCASDSVVTMSFVQIMGVLCMTLVYQGVKHEKTA